MIHLEKKTKIHKFENIFQQTLGNITHTYHWKNQQIRDLLLPYGITQQQYHVLSILKGQYPSPSTVNLIKMSIRDKMSDISRIIDRLLFKGYVEKTANHYDKRAVDVVISDRGWSLLKKIEREVDFSDIIQSNLTFEEAAQLQLLLDKMRR